MQAPPAVIAIYERALPDDPRVKRKQMFGTPCAFVNRQMFFGTFGESLIARIGPERVATVRDQPGLGAFAPTEGKVWDDYVQIDPGFDPDALASLAVEALAWAADLPRKGRNPGKKPRA